MADAFVSKPFRETELLQAIGNCLGIQYEYEAVPSTSSETQLSDLPDDTTVEAAAGLPEGLADEIRSAVIALEVDRLTALIHKVKDLDRQLASAMQAMVERFDFESLEKLIQPPQQAGGASQPHDG